MPRIRLHVYRTVCMWMLFGLQSHVYTVEEDGLKHVLVGSLFSARASQRRTRLAACADTPTGTGTPAEEAAAVAAPGGPANDEVAQPVSLVASSGVTVRGAYGSTSFSNAFGLGKGSS